MVADEMQGVRSHRRRNGDVRVPQTVCGEIRNKFGYLKMLHSECLIEETRGNVSVCWCHLFIVVWQPMPNYFQKNDGLSLDQEMQNNGMGVFS